MRPLFTNLVVLTILATATGCASAASSTEIIEVPERTVRVIGPLEQFAARIHGSVVFENSLEWQAWLDSIHFEAEEHIAACMRAQGFDYTLNPSPGRRINDPWSIAFSIPYGTRAWAETYGFGVSHPALLPLDGPAFGTHHADELLDEMTESERDSWFYALYGADYDNHLLRAGCFREAQRATDPGWTPPQVTGFEPIAEEMDRFLWLIAPWNDESPFYTEVNADWQNCMAQTGLALPNSHSPRQLESAMHSEFHNLRSQITWGAATSAAETVRLNREIEFAVANWDCVNEVDYDARILEIELALQEEFVEQHGNLLEEWAISNELYRAQTN